jgi:hypothetical protein
MSLFAALKTDPKSFLKSLGPTPFYIDEPPDYTPGLKQMQHSRLQPNSAATVIGLDRIAFCAITRTPNRITAGLDMDYKPGKAEIPCYWLPWMRDGIVRIKLKPSKKLIFGHHPKNYVSGVAKHGLKVVAGKTIKGQGVQVDQENLFDWRPRLTNPYNEDVCLFFTGMMDGCSTWVAGDPREPEVYHVNCASYKVSQETDLLRSTKGQIESQRLRFVQQTNDFKALYHEKHGALPKARSANAVDVKLTQHKPATISETGAFHTKELMLLRKLVKNIGNQRYKIVKTYYSAFGFKVDGLWSFYRQTIHEYVAADDQWNLIRNSPTLAVGEAPVKFFP